MTLTIKPGQGTGNYDLYDGTERVGSVRKKVTRYNLRRLIVSTEWILRMSGHEPSSHNRRMDAVAQAERNLAAGGALAADERSQ